jgi:hypothetical protein
MSKSLSHPWPVLGALLVACVASVVWVKLSPATAFLVLVAGLSLPKLQAATRRLAWGLITVSAIAAGIGFTRFVLTEAIPGVIAGGQAAATKHAIAFARSVVVAEDHARKQALLDPDQDGIGSALELLALAGLAPLRDGRSLSPGPLFVRPERVRESPLGPLVEESGYLFALCLPAQGGGWTTDPTRRVDEEAAERNYALYAWPVTSSPGSPRESIFIDARERILVHAANAGGPAYHGIINGPRCDAFEADAGWLPWKDKQPRAVLPGDPS